MPLRPRQPCPVPSCAYLKPCPVHQRKPSWNVDPNRGSTDERGYGNKHQNWWRLAVLAEYPFCVGEPRSKGCPDHAIATIADHITPISQGGAPLELTNGQGMCASCHARKSQRERIQAKPYRRFR